MLSNLYPPPRTGCMPFVEVYQDGERVYTSVSEDSTDSIRSFYSEDRSVEVPLNVTVQGNITINVYHIRAIPAEQSTRVVSGAGLNCKATRNYGIGDWDVVS